MPTAKLDQPPQTRPMVRAEELLDAFGREPLFHKGAESFKTRLAWCPRRIPLPRTHAMKHHHVCSWENELQPWRHGVDNVKVGNFQKLEEIGKKQLDAARDLDFVRERAAYLLERIEQKDHADIIAVFTPDGFIS